MTTLRWVILGVGVLIVAGIYIWGRQRSDSRHKQFYQGEESFDDEILKQIEIDRDDADLGGAVGELDNLIADKLGGNHAADDMSSFTAKTDDDGDFGISAGEMNSQEEDSTVYRVEKTALADGDELIIVLNVMAEPGRTFNGVDIFEAIEQVDMTYGDMHIFHHYGVGNMSTTQPAFSMANIIEPGIFSDEGREELETPGLCLFLRIPGPMDGRVAFELMLNTGRRLSELLGGDLRDDTRSVVTLQTVSHIRDRIIEFNRKQLVNS